MKILLAKSFPKLTFIVPIAKILKEKGHDVHILVPGQHADTIKMEQLGIPVHINEIILPRMLRTNTLAGDWQLFRSLIRLLKEQSFDIINLHLPAARLFGRLAALFSRKGKVISVIHGNEIHHERMTNWIDSATICVSNTVRQFLVAQGLPTKKLTVIHNGVDLAELDVVKDDKYYLHRELNLPITTKIIGMVAYFYGPSPAVHKGHEYFFDAAKIVCEKHPDVRFAVVGDNRLVQNEKERFQNYVRDLGLENKVFFLGEREDIAAIMSSFYIHVLPSVKEGFGMVLLEAMARGVPNIASKIGSICEIITHNKTGLLFEPRDYKALSLGMLELIENPQKARELGVTGRKHCEASFSAQKMVDAYEYLFLEILNS